MKSNNDPTTATKNDTSTDDDNHNQSTTTAILEVPAKECTDTEYNELLQLASTIGTVEEAKLELLECARYGEMDSVRALLETHSNSIINCSKNDDGVTALHKASANGHTLTVQLLLAHGAHCTANASGGNTPLHWAAANSHDSVIALLLQHVPNIDVLTKNEFGKSALTEGFTSQNTKSITLLLEHDSASEERLIDGAATTTTTVNNNESSNANLGIIHEFDFLRDGRNDTNMTQNKLTNEEPTNTVEEDTTKETKKTLSIRELPITNADNPFGEVPMDDTTGLGIWCASIVMARWMASLSCKLLFEQKSVLELGSGCGLPGLAIALYNPNVKSIYVTDLNPKTIENLQYNIQLNSNSTNTSFDQIKALSMDWGDESTWPNEKLDCIIGSDLIYQKSIVPLLKQTILKLLKKRGSFYYVCPCDGPRDGLQEFITTMKEDGLFQCNSESNAPELYRTNPLHSGNDEDALVHFHELPVTNYTLYEFQRIAKDDDN